MATDRNPARSTRLRRAAEHCPGANDLLDRGVSRLDRPQVGIVVHDFLHALAEGRSLDTVAERLIAEGRTGHDADGPFDPDAVAEARALAEAQDLTYPTELAWYELGIGFHPGWIPCGYNHATWLETRIDRVEIAYDDDPDWGDVTVMEVADYKSAWPAGERDLDTIQRKIQVVAVSKILDRLAPDVTIDAIDAVIYNLRTKATARRRIWLDDDPTLTRWQRDIEIAVAAYRRPVVYSPGPGCIGCPVGHGCEHRHAAAESESDLPRAYAASRARTEALASQVRRVVKDAGEPVVLPDGSAVGYLPRARASVRSGIEREIWERWRGTNTPSDDLIVGMIRALKPGVTAIRRLAKTLAESRDEREALEARWLTETTSARFDYDKPGTHATEATDAD